MIASKNVNVFGKIQTLYTIPNFGPFLYGQDRLLALELNIEISAGAEISNITIIFCLGDSFIQSSLQDTHRMSNTGCSVSLTDSEPND